MGRKTIKFALTGKLAGQTTVLNGHRFLKGVAAIVVEDEHEQHLLTYMARAHQAYPLNSQELRDAQNRAGKKADDDGLRSDLQADTPVEDGASAPVQGAADSGAGSVPEARALLGGADDAGSTGSEGLVPSGSGHEDAGLGDGVVAEQDVEPVAVTDEPAPEPQPVVEDLKAAEALMAKIRVALTKLSSQADEHWTTEGLPAVQTVAEIVQDQRVTRAMIDAVAPGFNRRSADEVAAL